MGHTAVSATYASSVTLLNMQQRAKSITVIFDRIVDTKISTVQPVLSKRPRETLKSLA